MTVHSFGRHLVLLLVAAFLSGVCVSAKTVRVDAPRAQMTVRQARKALVDAISHMTYTKLVRDVKFSRDKVVWVCTGNNLYPPSDPDYDQILHGSISFGGIKTLTIKNKSNYGYEVVVDTKPLVHGGAYNYFQTEQYAMRFVDAVLTLRNSVLAPDTEEADFAAFSVSANIWLVTTPKPEMPDDARTHKLLAEDAFKRKDFAAALDAYGDALDKHPMWPEGHYNAALLAAETGDYELAAHHMRCYLVLAPNAKDATAAKDKFLLWQLKAKE